MTLDKPMRERMARALCREYDDLPDTSTYMHRKSNPGKHWLDKAEVLSDVDAMLEELEHPTFGMRHETRCSHHGAEQDRVAAYREFIAAIRNGA